MVSSNSSESGDRLSRMRARQHETFGVPPPPEQKKQSAAQSSAARQQQAKGRPPKVIVGLQRLARDGETGCGHTDDFPVVKGEPSAFTEGRFQKWRNKKCAACRFAIETRQQQDAAIRRADKPAKGNGRRYPEFRLPNGSEFSTVYNGDTQLWTAQLVVPGLTAYHDTGSSLHKLLIKLGRRWHDEHGAIEGKAS
jgi:hypothetical protein